MKELLKSHKTKIMLVCCFLCIIVGAALPEQKVDPPLEVKVSDGCTFELTDCVSSESVDSDKSENWQRYWVENKEELAVVESSVIPKEEHWYRELENICGAEAEVDRVVDFFGEYMVLMSDQGDSDDGSHLYRNWFVFPVSEDKLGLISVASADNNHEELDTQIIRSLRKDGQLYYASEDYMKELDLSQIMAGRL